MSKRKKAGRQVSGNPAKRPTPKTRSARATVESARDLPPTAIPLEQHAKWTYYEDIDSRVPYVKVERGDGTEQVYSGSSAKVFKERSLGLNHEQARQAVAIAAIEKFQSYLITDESTPLSPTLRQGPFIACKCGCNEYYPERWLSEVAPVIFQVMADGNAAMLERMNLAAYAPEESGIPGLAGREGVMLMQEEGMSINLFTADSLLEAGRLWDKDKMNAFADFVVDVTAGARVAYEQSRRGRRG